MLRLSELYGMAVFAARSGGATFVQLGKVRMAVFAPNGRLVVGYMVRRPDIAGMVRRPDAFVARDSVAACDGGLCVVRNDGMGDAALKRLNLLGDAWDRCIVWSGMDVLTEGGDELGFVGDVSFDAQTGEVVSFYLGDGGVARRLVGVVEMPASLLRGYRDGRMIVDDEAAKMRPAGGFAARAGAATGKAQVEGGRLAAKAGAAADKAVAQGSRALGRQLGKTKGMLGAFMDEYRKASR